MKKIKKVLLIYVLLAVSIVQWILPADSVQAKDKPAVSAHAYVVMDANSGKVLYSQNPDKKIYPASTVKLMTALVVLDHCSLSEKVNITKKMLKQVPAGTSNAGLKAGTTYTVSDLLHMLLLPSAADAAVCLSVKSCGSTRKFVSNMNKKAKELGLTHSSFDNPIGLDIGDDYYKTYTNARDFAKLGRYAMSNKTIRSIVNKPSYRVPKSKKQKSFVIHNTNAFLSTVAYPKNLYTIIGTKTGTTQAAGSVLIATATDDNGHEVICAFFGNQTRDQMYDDIKKLLRFTFVQAKNNKISLTTKNELEPSEEDSSSFSF